MLLRIFFIIFAIISPPLSALYWQGSRPSTQINFVVWCVAIGIFFEFSAAIGILIHSLLVLHAFFLIVFCKNDGFFNSDTSNKEIFFLHLWGGLLVFSLTIFFFHDRIQTERRIVLDIEAIANGKQLFNSCSVCHKLTRNNFVGPHLVGVFGRDVGSLTDYKYSESMAQADFIWTDENLIQFLQNPNEFLPGTRMAITPLAKKDASDIVIYLKSN